MCRLILCSWPHCGSSANGTSIHRRKGKLPFPSSVVPKSSCCRILSWMGGVVVGVFVLSSVIDVFVDGRDRNTHKLQSMTQHPCIKFVMECSLKNNKSTSSCIWSAPWVIKSSLRRWVMMSYFGNHRWDSRGKNKSCSMKSGGERRRLEATVVMWKSVSGRRG